MNNRIMLYALMCFFWIAFGAAILLGYLDNWLGRAEDWKRYLAVGICGLCLCLNLLRIRLIRVADQRARERARNEQSQ